MKSVGTNRDNVMKDGDDKIAACSWVMTTRQLLLK